MYFNPSGIDIKMQLEPKCMQVLRPFFLFKKWQSTQDEEGRTYYYNKNNETVWEIPTHDDQNKLSPLEDAQVRMRIRF